MNHTIIHLPKDRWQGHALPFGYRTEACYDVRIEQDPSGFTISMERKPFDAPVEQRFSDALYADWWPEACAWGVEKGGKLVAAIETCPETWSNRLRVTELWVDTAYRRQGIGHALMDVAREQARLERRRAIILKTQSRNVPAIDFYLHEGFTLIGMDVCCYSNNDLENKDVRLEFGWFAERKARVSRQDVEIREERPEDRHAVERVMQRAFWNKYQKGGDDHYLVHRLRGIEEYLPHLSRVALKDGEMIGAIFYTRAFVHDGATRHNILTFGPLGVSPEWQGRGVGELLLEETMRLAADAGWPGIVIFGEPDYYPRLGFKTCDQFGITTRDGTNFDAFMGIELVPGGMNGIHGVFHQTDLLYGVPAEEAEAYGRNFPPLEKQYFPQQWVNGVPPMLAERTE